MTATIACPPSSRKPKTPTLSEAPCSVNTFVETSTLGRIQVTGRGTTPAEAVANLQGMVEALRPPPPPVRSREERLAQLLTCGLTRATAKGEWAMVEKLAHAAALVLSGAVQPGERDGVLTVRSRSNSELWYDVENGCCSCTDYMQKAKEGETYYCKHLVCVLMFQRLAATA